MIWFWILIAGLVTFFTRYSMISFINPGSLSNKTKKILTYVPSAVFPAIIFPAVFLDKQGLLVSVDNPQVWAFGIAIIVGYYSKNIIFIITSGLVSFWLFSYFMN